VRPTVGHRCEAHWRPALGLGWTRSTDGGGGGAGARGWRQRATLQLGQGRVERLGWEVGGEAAVGRGRQGRRQGGGGGRARGR
jgi:hypothetical protein